MDAREIARAVRQLASRSVAERDKPAIVRYADELADMQAGLQVTHEDAGAATQWYDANDLQAIVSPLASGDIVPGTNFTKSELTDLHALRAAFITWAETQIGDIYRVPVNAGSAADEVDA